MVGINFKFLASLAGLDPEKFGFYLFQSFFVYCCHINIDFNKSCI